MREISADQILARDLAAGRVAHRPRAIGDDRLDLRARLFSVNFSPLPENTLMPLSANGLCDAEITTPRS